MYLTLNGGGLEQILGVIIGSFSVCFITSLLPQDLVPLIKGKSGGWKKWAKGFLFGIAFTPVILLSTWIVGIIVSLISPEVRPPQVALELLAQIPRAGIVFWLLLFTVVSLVPYIEETLFRGMLQGFLNGICHPTLSILLTSSAFSLFHYSPLQKSSNFEIIAGLFVFSILASKIRLKEDSLAASIGMHAAFNAASLCLFLGLS